MAINSINGANAPMGQMGMNQATDSYSRNIQKQIANAQKQLQELSSNEDMTLEEKMKKRQELQQQINDLNMQLRQHQIEQRSTAMAGSEKQQNGTSMDDMLGGTGSAERTKSGSKNAGLSQASMTAMISADNSMKQAKVQGNVASRFEGRAGVLEIEIKLDESRAANGLTANTEDKRAELAEAEQKAMDSTTAQMETLGEAHKSIEEANKADNSTNKEKTTVPAEENVLAETPVPEQTQKVSQPVHYTSVDIRL